MRFKTYLMSGDKQITRISNYNATIKPLNDFRETVEEIRRLGDAYWEDLLKKNKFNVDFRKMNAKQFFDFIQKLPYVPDPSGMEYLSRPEISLALSMTGHPFDCDDRTILTRAFLRLKNYLLSGNPEEPFVPFVKVTGRSSAPHHVFTVFKTRLADSNIPFDPTYPQNIFGKELFPAGFAYIK